MVSEAVFSYDIGFGSHKGAEREINEDHYCAETRMDEDEEEIAVVGVSDGFGGFSLGEIASKVTVNQLEKFFKLGEFQQMYEEADYTDPTRVIQELYTRINHVVKSLMEEKNRQVGSTLVSGFFRGDQAYIANFGHTRAYLIRSGAMKKITRNRADEKGGKAGVNEKSSKFSNTLGSEITVNVDITNMKLRDGDILLFCSDGLYNQVDEMEILEIVKREPFMQSVCDFLIDKARQAKDSDDITVVALQVNAEKPPRDVLSGFRDKDGKVPLPMIIIGVLFAILVLLSGGLVIKRFVFNKGKETRIPQYTNERDNPLTNVNSYNSLTLETEIPLSYVTVNKDTMPFAEDLRTFAFSGDQNEVDIIPNLVPLEPKLYKIIISGYYRNFSVIQASRNKVIIDPDKIVLHLTYGSEADYFIEHHRQGDIFVLRVNNLASPFTVRMESQENIYASIEHDKREQKENSPASADSEGEKTETEGGLIVKPPKKGGEKFDYELED
ncbi:MAG: PP2C family protein-serine/threonine phosphatase [Vulcanimicrobiota bacterium]